MSKEKVMEMAMQMIAFSGSAFDNFNRAIDAAEEGKLQEAEQHMLAGKEDLRQAHDAQTDLLAAEAGEEEIPLCILMVHAQDHLTMAIFAERMAKHFLAVWRREKENV